MAALDHCTEVASLSHKEFQKYFEFIRLERSIDCNRTICVVNIPNLIDCYDGHSSLQSSIKYKIQSSNTAKIKKNVSMIQNEMLNFHFRLMLQ